MIFLFPVKKIIDRAGTIYAQIEHPPGEPPMTAMLMITSMLMNGIEALGSFLTTSDKNGVCFDKFMDKYMPDWIAQVTVPHHARAKLSRVLWKSYRNGLAHSFVIKNAGIEPVPDPDKYIISHTTLQIDAWKFFDDLVAGVNTMFQDVRNDPQANRLFLRRFKKVYGC